MCWTCAAYLFAAPLTGSVGDARLSKKTLRQVECMEGLYSTDASSLLLQGDKFMPEFLKPKQLRYNSQSNSVKLHAV